MALKKYRPTSPGRRAQTVASFEELTKRKPEKSLLRPYHRTGGRNNLGRITSRWRGGGHKRRYREVDFKRNKDGVPAKVAAIEYDPNRSAYLALLHYRDGEKRYILWPEGLQVGAEISSGKGSEIGPGNALDIADIPMGEMIHNVELRKGRGGQMMRSAGSSAQLMAKEGNYAVLKLQSGEVRQVPLACRATLGKVGNSDYENISLGKAGRSRWLGRMPRVRGVVMNPVDHPHGGGEGKTSGGRHPVTPWGMPTKGYKTRGKKPSDRLIIRRRNKR